MRPATESGAERHGDLPHLRGLPLWPGCQPGPADHDGGPMEGRVLTGTSYR